MRKLLAVVFVPLMLGAVVPAFGSSSLVALKGTPCDLSGRYSISVAHVPLPQGGVRYTVTVRLTRGNWPLRLEGGLATIVDYPLNVGVKTQRSLLFAKAGNVRSFALDVTQSEAAHWCFLLSEYAENRGRPMPGFTGI